MGIEFQFGMMKKYWRWIRVRLHNNEDVLNATREWLKWWIICIFTIIKNVDNNACYVELLQELNEIELL